MLKTVKFGGSSLADANQFRKAAAIIRKDESRRYVVVSAPGKGTRVIMTKKLSMLPIHKK